MLSVAQIARFGTTPGLTLLFLGDAPNRSRETVDLLVIAPEIRALFGAVPITSGAVIPRDTRSAETLKRAVAPWGVKRLPAIVLLLEGRALGALEGLHDWQGYQSGLVEILLRCKEEYEIPNEDTHKDEHEGRKNKGHRTIPIVPAERAEQTE